MPLGVNTGEVATAVLWRSRSRDAEFPFARVSPLPVGMVASSAAAHLAIVGVGGTQIDFLRV